MPTPEFSQHELDLAKRLDALEAQAAKPTLPGEGLLSVVLNSIVRAVPPKLITAAVVLFLGWHAWSYFNSWQQFSAETEKLDAQAAALAADADAKGLNLEGDTLQTQKMLTVIATLKADIDRTRAEADKTQAEADAQNQKIGEIKIAVLQKQAEVETLEAEAQKSIQETKFQVRNAKVLVNNPFERLIEQLMNGTTRGLGDGAGEK